MREAVFPEQNPSPPDLAEPRAAVTGTATAGRACSERIVDINALVAVELCTALSFCSDELALGQLTAAPNHRS